MTVIFVFATLVLILSRLHAQTDNPNSEKFTGPNGNEMIINKYFKVLLIRGKRRDLTLEKTLLEQKNHTEYFTSLWERGIILIKGHFD